MAGVGLLVAMAALFVGQPICQALGLPSWAAIIISKLTEKKIVGTKAMPLVGLEYVQGVEIIGITNETPEAVKAWMAKSGVEFKYSVACDSSSQNCSSYGVQGFPTAFVVDKEGTVVWQGHPRSGLDEALASLLQPASS